MCRNSGGRSVSRRRTIRAVGTGVAVGLAGCLGGESESAPEPLNLSGQKSDYQGGMIIGDYGGPNGQIFYADTEPTPKGRSADASPETKNVAWFHTLAHGLFPYHFRMLNRGAEARAIYVTDYSRVEWTLPQDTDRKQMPTPTTPESFADATELQYAIETDVLGGMGPDLMPFSDAEEADAFASTHGGRTVGYDDIDSQLIESLQMTDME